MRELNEAQKEFIIGLFTNHEFNGWRRIAEILITKGSCIVAGKESIWNGGIGNFIKTSETDNAIDCLKYEFDLDEFLNSVIFIDAYQEQLNLLTDKIQNLKQEYTELYGLVDLNA